MRAKQGKQKKVKQKRKKLTESQVVSLLISAVSHKKYAEANKYLKGIINSKIKERIRKAVETPLF